MGAIFFLVGCGIIIIGWIIVIVIMVKGLNRHKRFCEKEETDLPKPDYFPPPQTKPCLCFYPCKTTACPKEKGSVCHINYCDIVHQYSKLTYHKNYCSECGRKLEQ